MSILGENTPAPKLAHTIAVKKPSKKRKEKPEKM
jgi:hypothetical protein